MSREGSLFIESPMKSPRYVGLIMRGGGLGDVSLAGLCFTLCLLFLQYKLGKVKRVALGKKGIPYCVTHDGRTIRYPDPLISVNDTVQVDIASGKIIDYIKFDIGNIVMATGGRNLGRVGLITHRERHHGSFDIIHIKDALGHSFATRMTNVFVIGKGQKAMVSLPRQKGLRLTVAEERDRRLEAKQL